MRPPIFIYMCKIIQQPLWYAMVPKGLLMNCLFMLVLEADIYADCCDVCFALITCTGEFVIVGSVVCV